MQFLLWRSLWRWAIWVRVLIGLGRIELDLVPSHPDRRGGISFLRWPSTGYCSMLVFAISSMLCASQVTRFTASGVTLKTFTPLLIAFAAAGTLIAFGPLLVFSPQLMRARRIGLIEYGRLGAEYGRGFQRRGDLLSLDLRYLAVEMNPQSAARLYFPVSHPAARILRYHEQTTRGAEKRCHLHAVIA